MQSTHAFRTVGHLHIGIAEGFFDRNGLMTLKDFLYKDWHMTTTWSSRDKTLGPDPWDVTRQDTDLALERTLSSKRAATARAADAELSSSKLLLVAATDRPTIAATYRWPIAYRSL